MPLGRVHFDIHVQYTVVSMKGLKLSTHFAGNNCQISPAILILGIA